MGFELTLILIVVALGLLIVVITPLGLHFSKRNYTDAANKLSYINAVVGYAVILLSIYCDYLGSKGLMTFFVPMILISCSQIPSINLMLCSLGGLVFFIYSSF